jgi:hypothetical protein
MAGQFSPSAMRRRFVRRFKDSGQVLGKLWISCPLFFRMETKSIVCIETFLQSGGIRSVLEEVTKPEVTERVEYEKNKYVS